MPASWRCGVCNINWPHESAYHNCSKCGGSTSYRNLDADDVLTSAQAKYKVKEIAFEEFYKERGEKPLLPEHALANARAIARAEEQQALELLFLRSSQWSSDS